MKLGPHAMSLALLATSAGACGHSQVQDHADAVEIARAPRGANPPALAATAENAQSETAGLTGYEKRIAEARIAGKPVLLEFGAAWCAICKELDKQTIPDPRVQRELARFAVINVDATDDEDEEVKRMMAAHHVVGLPALVVLDATGREVARVIDFVLPEQLTKTLQTVR